MVPSPNRQDPVKELNRALDEGYRLLLEEHCPPALLVDPSGQVLHVFVNADLYLKFPAGAVQLGLTDLLTPKLAAVASAALATAFREENRAGGYPEIIVSQAEDLPPLGLRVLPISNRPGSRDFALVTFRSLEKAESSHPMVTLPEMEGQAQQHILALTQELRQLRTTFQTTVEELETTNEELQATNEEFQSTSQEYQATAEQLRRELRIASQDSMELAVRNEAALHELQQEVATYQSYLEHSHPAVLFLDGQLRILRATAGVYPFLPILGQDLGRPIEHIAPAFKQKDFLRKARQVLDEGRSFDDIWTLEASEKTIRIVLRPFGPGGVVVTFTPSPVLCEGLLQAIRQPAALVNREGRMLGRNQAWTELPAREQIDIQEYLNSWPDGAEPEAGHLLPVSQSQLTVRQVLEESTIYLVVCHVRT